MIYFNRFNRDCHFMMLHLWNVIKKWLEDSGCQLTSTERKKLTEAIELIKDVTRSLARRLDAEYGHKVLRDLKSTVVAVQRGTYIDESVSVVKRKSIDYMGEMALLVCNNQAREACIKFKKCKMYQALSDAGVATFGEETNACPYRAENYCKKTDTWTPLVDVPQIEKNYKQAACKQCGQVWNVEDGYKVGHYCPDCGGELGEWR